MHKGVAYLLSQAASRAITISLEGAIVDVMSQRLEHGDADHDDGGAEAGLEAARLHSNVEVPLSTGWGPALGLWVALFIVMGLAEVPGMEEENPDRGSAIVLGVMFFVMATGVGVSCLVCVYTRRRWEEDGET